MIAFMDNNDKNQLEQSIDELKGDLGSKTNLNTDNKSTIVSAINEVNNRFLLPVADAVGDWLDDHPEVTTTVVDKSLSIQKFNDGLRHRVESAFYKNAFSNMNREYRYLSYNNTYANKEDHIFRQQGGCIVDGKTAIHMCAVYGESTTITKIIEVDLKEKTVVREEYANLGHANCVSYYDGYLYVTGEDGYTYYKVDYQTLSEITEITSTINHSELFMFNGDLYQYGKNSVFKNGVKLFDTCNMSGKEQAMCVSEHGIFFVRSNAYCIYHYSFDGELLNVYNINAYYGLYVTGEPEAMSIYNDMVYLFTNSGLKTSETDYYLFNVFSTSLYTGSFSYRRNTNEEFIDTVFVDGSNNTNLNPTGAKENPFPTITEAIMTLPTRHSNIYIDIAEGEYFEKIYLKGINQFVKVVGHDAIVYGLIDATYVPTIQLDGISVKYDSSSEYMVKLNAGLVTYFNVTLIDNPPGNNPIFIANCSDVNLVVKGLNGGYVYVSGDIPIKYVNQVTQNKIACNPFHASTAIYSGQGEYTPPKNVQTNYKNGIYNALELNIQSRSYHQTVVLRFDNVDSSLTYKGVLSVVYNDIVIMCPWVVVVDADGKITFTAEQSYGNGNNAISSAVAGLRDVSYKRI